MMPLTLVSDGEEVRLVAVRGGQHIRRRLADLGLNLDMKMRVLNGNGQGPLILAVRDSRLAIGRGMAHKIMVRPADDDQP